MGWATCAFEFVSVLDDCAGAKSGKCLVLVKCSRAGGSEVEIGCGYSSVALYLVDEVGDVPVSGKCDFEKWSYDGFNG